MVDVTIDRDLAKKVLETVDAGLSHGLGMPKPGEMCVEAAVCFALGLPHGDEPPCVADSLRNLKIKINDCNWSSNAARAKGLRRLAIAQLGTNADFDEEKLATKICEHFLPLLLPFALEEAEKAAKMVGADEYANFKEAAEAALKDPTFDNLEKARSIASNNGLWTAGWILRLCRDASGKEGAGNVSPVTTASEIGMAIHEVSRILYFRGYRTDDTLSEYCEAIVQMLIELKAKGAEWLDLAPFESTANAAGSS